MVLCEWKSTGDRWIPSKSTLTSWVVSVNTSVWIVVNGDITRAIHISEWLVKSGSSCMTSWHKNVQQNVMPTYWRDFFISHSQLMNYPYKKWWEIFHQKSWRTKKSPFSTNQWSVGGHETLPFSTNLWSLCSLLKKSLQACRERMCWLLLRGAILWCQSPQHRAISGCLAPPPCVCAHEWWAS